MKGTTLRRLFLFVFFIVLYNSTKAQVPTNADCLGAIPICQSVYTFSSSVHGIGNYTDIPVMGATSTNFCPNSCISAGESNSTWFIFTTQNAGLINFTITPINGGDDYDWAVYNMTTNSCSDIYNGGMQVSCNYCLNTGPTGPNGGSGSMCEGPNGCTQFNAPIPAGANQTFVLMIDNFSSSNFGYTLDFGASTAQIFDNVPPQMITLQTPIACGASQLNITFSENILCSTITPADFTLTGPGGPYTVTYISGSACTVGGTMENTFILTIVPDITTAGSYSLNLVNSAGSVSDNCGNIAPIVSKPFTISGPTVGLTPSSASYCGSGSVILTASGASTYSWSPSSGLSGTTGASVTANPSVTTTYTVVGNTSGCVDTETTTITVNPIPSVTVTQNPLGAQCAGTTITLNASSNIPGSTFTWSTGPSGSSITVTPPTSTTYTITVTSPAPASCTNTALVPVTINPLPNVVLTPFASVCTNTPAFALSNGSPSGGTYSGTGVSGGNFNPATAGAGTYTITYTYTDGNSCTNSDQENITVNLAPTVTLQSFNPVCVNAASFALSGGSPAGGTYSGTGVSGGNFNPATAGVGTHTITYSYTNGNNCSGSAQQTITVNALPTVTLQPFAAVCSDLPAFALSGGSPAGGTYSGTGVSGGNFDPSTAGAGSHTITYTYTDGNSCTNSASQNITVNAAPTATFTVNPMFGCNMMPVTATYIGNAGAGATFNWNFDGGNAVPGTGVGPHNITFSSQGAYDIILSVTENGCTSQPDTVTIAIGGIIGTASVVSNVLCYNGNTGEATVTVNGGVPPLTYSWNTVPPQSGQNATGLVDGTYIVNITDSIGCTSSDTITISEPTALTADITDSTMIECFGGNDGSAEATANGGTPPYDYVWASNTSTTSQATNYVAGNYSVTVTDDNGCSVVVPFSITQNPLLSVSLVPQDEGCENSCDGQVSAVVNGGVSPYSFVWSPGTAVTQVITGLCPGTYTVTVTDDLNCTATISATIATSTFIDANGDATPVEGVVPLIVNFTFTGSGASTYSWDFGDGNTSNLQNPVNTYNLPGEYTVTLTVNSGAPDFCVDTYIITINVLYPSMIEIPNVYTPNNDGFNDVFTVKSEGLQTESMVIFNRWGKKVFEWGEVHGSWDGTAISGGQASDGEYYYIFSAKGFDGIEYNQNGTVTLLR
jgi:gliding motility-associated-like protein